MDSKWALKVWMARLTALRQWTSGGHKLVTNFTVFFYYVAKFLADLVFEHLVFNGLDTVLMAVNDAVVGVDAVVVVLGLEEFDEEEVAFTVVGKHDI